MRILSRMMGRIQLNESYKKLLTLMLVIVLRGVVIEFAYVVAFMYFTRGVLRVVILGVYVFITVSVCVWILLLLYVVLGLFVQDNYKIIGIGVLPLVVFFVKICGS